MKVIDRYDYGEELNERYCGTMFFIEEDEYLGKSHSYSYLHIRNLYKEMGDVMGLEGLKDVGVVYIKEADLKEGVGK